MKREKLTQRKSSWEWYVVKLLFECIISGNPTSESIDINYSNTHKTYEESIILVKAQSFEHAYSIAEIKSKEAEHDYNNPYDELVQWRFIKALDCFILIDDILKTGTELYSRFLRVPKNITTEEVIAHYYPETGKDVMDYNFVLRNRHFNVKPNST